MRYLIDTGNELLGMCSHITKDIGNDFDKYITRYGFVDAESALECAKELGIDDCKIICVNELKTIRGRV